MSWPTTGAGSLASGYMAQGVTTIRWGTNGVSSVTGFLVVVRASQRNLVENIKLPNGDGVSATRVQLVDGVEWDIVVRDDTTQVPSGLRIGQTIAIKDMAGHLGTVGLDYVGRVIGHNYEAAVKQPGERTLTVENLLLVESQTGS
jgi:hypothetical protein